MQETELDGAIICKIYLIHSLYIHPDIDSAIVDIYKQIIILVRIDYMIERQISSVYFDYPLYIRVTDAEIFSGLCELSQEFFDILQLSLTHGANCNVEYASLMISNNGLLFTLIVDYCCCYDYELSNKCNDTCLLLSRAESKNLLLIAYKNSLAVDLS